MVVNFPRYSYVHRIPFSRFLEERKNKNYLLSFCIYILHINVYLSYFLVTLGAKGGCKAGGINDVGGGPIAPFLNGSGGLCIPSAENSGGKPGAR